MPFSNCPRFLHRPRTDFTSDNLDLDPKEIKKMDERLKGGYVGVVGTTSPPPLLPHLEGLWLGWRSTATFFAVGCGGGVFGSALGLGGGVIVVPLLVHLGLTQAQAHGTSLVSVAGNAVAASYTYLSGGFVELSAAALLAITAIPTSRLGVHVASRVNGAQLRRYFGWWVILTASLLPLKPYLPALVDLGAEEAVGGAPYYLSIACLGLGAGFTSSLLGVGGGLLMVPCLVLSGFSQQVAQGTALTGMIVPAFYGSYQHHQKGNVVLGVAIPLVAGALFGGLFGGSLALYLPEATLRTIFVVGMCALGFRYIRS
jgi:uncharacterized membrane protein YfcA